MEAQHRKVFEARANLIWSVTTPQARRGHFAMGVGLEAGLTIDAMAEEVLVPSSIEPTPRPCQETSTNWPMPWRASGSD